MHLCFKVVSFWLIVVGGLVLGYGLYIIREQINTSNEQAIEFGNSVRLFQTQIDVIRNTTMYYDGQPMDLRTETVLTNAFKGTVPDNVSSVYWVRNHTTVKPLYTTTYTLYPSRKNVSLTPHTYVPGSYRKGFGQTCSEAFAKAACSTGFCCDFDDMEPICDGEDRIEEEGADISYRKPYNDSITRCSIGQECGTCGYNVYLRTACNVIRWNWTQFKYIVDEEMTSCNYPFTERDHDYDTNTSTDVAITVRTHLDPHIMFEKITEGERAFGANLEAQMEAGYWYTNVGVLFLGMGIILLMIGDACYRWGYCSEKRRRKRERERKRKQAKKNKKKGRLVVTETETTVGEDDKKKKKDERKDDDKKKKGSSDGKKLLPPPLPKKEIKEEPPEPQKDESPPQQADATPEVRLDAKPDSEALVVVEEVQEEADPKLADEPLLAPQDPSTAELNDAPKEGDEVSVEVVPKNADGESNLGSVAIAVAPSPPRQSSPPPDGDHANRPVVDSDEESEETESSEESEETETSSEEESSSEEETSEDSNGYPRRGAGRGRRSGANGVSGSESEDSAGNLRLGGRRRGGGGGGGGPGEEDDAYAMRDGDRRRRGAHNPLFSGGFGISKEEAQRADALRRSRDPRHSADRRYGSRNRHDSLSVSDDTDGPRGRHSTGNRRGNRNDYDSGSGSSMDRAGTRMARQRRGDELGSDESDPFANGSAREVKRGRRRGDGDFSSDGSDPFRVSGTTGANGARRRRGDGDYISDGEDPRSDRQRGGPRQSLNRVGRFGMADDGEPRLGNSSPAGRSSALRVQPAGRRREDFGSDESEDPFKTGSRSALNRQGRRQASDATDPTSGSPHDRQHSGARSTLERGPRRVVSESSEDSDPFHHGRRGALERQQRRGLADEFGSARTPRSLPSAPRRHDDYNSDMELLPSHSGGPRGGLQAPGKRAVLPFDDGDLQLSQQRSSGRTLPPAPDIYSAAINAVAAADRSTGSARGAAVGAPKSIGGSGEEPKKKKKKVVVKKIIRYVDRFGKSLPALHDPFAKDDDPFDDKKASSDGSWEL